MSSNRYFRGDTLTAQTTFTIDGEIADPNVVTAHVVDPDGHQSSISAAQVETGIWQASYETSSSLAPGIWRIRITGVTDAEIDTEEQTFLVQS